MTYRDLLKTAPAARYVPGGLPLVGSLAGVLRSPGLHAAVRGSGRGRQEQPAKIQRNYN